MSSNPLGTALRAAREQHGLSIQKLAKAIGWTPSAISRIENGTRVPRPERLQAIAKLLKLDIDNLNRLTGRLRPEDIAYLKRRPLAAELLRQMAGGDVKERSIEKMIKLTKA